MNILPIFINSKIAKIQTLKIFLILAIVAGAISLVAGVGLMANGSKKAWIGIVIGAILLVIGITFLITKVKGKKEELTKLSNKLKKEIEKYTEEAYFQMAPLNKLFDSNVAARLFNKTCPLIEMDRIFDVTKYEMMKEKYGLWDNTDPSFSTLDLQSGSILGNPFVVFKDLNVAMRDHVYTGTHTITYSRGYGKERHIVTETLRATYVAPEPIYSKETYLVYGNEGAQKLSFSREKSNINQMSEEEIKKYVRKHEKDLDKLANEKMKKGGTFTPIGNPEFELFFGGLDRDNEIEFRLLFTALGQKSMMDLLKSKDGYGDDFSFKKVKGLNVVQSEHSQGTTLFVSADDYKGFDFEVVKRHFIEFNDNYFKALFFDFAPLLSIPLYSQYKTHDYIYKNTIKSNFVPFLHEVVSNRYNPSSLADPKTKTDVILKTNFESKTGKTDNVKVIAHSFEKVNRIAQVSVRGGDGFMHTVDVPWIEYIPLVKENLIQVSDVEVSDEAKFNSLGKKDVVYANGLISNVGGKLSVDINKIKDFMKKV